jgi:hypothetical protein
VIHTFLVTDEERGLLFLDGHLVEWLEPGRHTRYTFFQRLSLSRLDANLLVSHHGPEMAQVTPKDAGKELFVAVGQLALVTRDGIPKLVLQPGRYVLWQMKAKVEAQLVSTETLRSEIPEIFWSLTAASDLQTVLVLPFERALLYVDGTLREVLTEGRYAFHAVNRKLEVMRVDLREQELQVVGQELMTADKVTLRLNLILKYRIVDPVKSVQAVLKLQDALYSEAQMAARYFVASFTVDELIEKRSDATAQMADAIRVRAETWGVELLKLDLKDVVLPGDMKTLLNKVIEAEKKAAANSIYRREEVAATRSLANTAKMLENNPVLLRLKEMEAWKEIAERIPNLTVVMGGQELMNRLQIPALSTNGPTPKQPG